MPSMQVSTIDKFGRHSASNVVRVRGLTQGPPGVGFKLTSDNNYDIQGKRLCNLEDPLDSRDSATKFYVDSKIEGDIQVMKESVNSYTKSLIDKNVANATLATISSVYKDLARFADKIQDITTRLRTLESYFTPTAQN